jgi:hypothetical protein
VRNSKSIEDQSGTSGEPAPTGVPQDGHQRGDVLRLAKGMDIDAHAVDHLAQSHRHRFTCRIGEMIGLDREGGRCTSSGRAASCVPSPHACAEPNRHAEDGSSIGVAVLVRRVLATPTGGLVPSFPRPSTRGNRRTDSFQLTCFTRSSTIIRLQTALEISARAEPCRTPWIRRPTTSWPRAGRLSSLLILRARFSLSCSLLSLNGENQGSLGTY